MKRMLILLVTGVVLAVAIFLIAFYSWGYFNKRKPNVSNDGLNIVLSDNQSLDLTEQSPVDSSSINNVTPYVFSVKNDSTSVGKFEILLEDFISDDGKQLLSRNILEYQLKSESSIIKSGKLKDIENNIITIDEVLAQSSKKYELRIWVSADTPASEWVGRSYSYNVKVNQIS